jgi:hypothetical protein
MRKLGFFVIVGLGALAALWHYAPPQFWPLLEVYGLAECLLLIFSAMGT